MKSINIPQIEYISGNTPAESAELFNEAMMRLAQYHPTYERTGSDFYIFYQITKEEAQEEEEPEARTKRATCGTCIYLSRDLNRFGEVDKRKKWATCSKTDIRTRQDEAACRTYYRAREDVE